MISKNHQKLRIKRKGENNIDYRDSIEILQQEKPDFVVEEKLCMTIVPEEKDPLQVEYTADMLILSCDKPENKIERIQEMTILDTFIPNNVIQKKEELNDYFIDKKQLLTKESLEIKRSINELNEKIKDLNIHYQSELEKTGN